MEYGEAITPGVLERAVDLAREIAGNEIRSVESAAAEAVSRTFCVCVTSGEDAAEHRFSDVHRRLVEAVARRMRADDALAAEPNDRPQTAPES